MDKLLKVALMLTAVDRMSSVVGTASSRSIEEINKIKSAAKQVSEGMMLLGSAKAGFNLLAPALDAYEEMELAGARLKASMQTEGGMLDANMYNRMLNYAQQISDKYSGSTADYLDMMRVLKNNSVSEADILGGIGVGVEKLALLFNMKPAAIGEFAAHMRNDMGVAVKDMEKVMDLTARIHQKGVGKTGEEAVYEMNQFYSKVGLGLVNLKVQGMDAAQSIGALGAIFMRKGISGESVGTNFRRILDGLRDMSKIEKANKEAAKFNKTLEFYDKQGRFISIENFVGQLDKLKGLPTTAIAEILKPFSGRQGLSTDFLEVLASSGANEYNHMTKELFHLATLDQNIQPILSTYAKQKQVLASTWSNTKAAIGSMIVPALTKFVGYLNIAAIHLRQFIYAHPGLTKILIGMLGIVSSTMGVAGAFKIVKGLNALGLFGPLPGILRLFGFTIFKVVLPALGMLGKQILIMGARGFVAGVTFMAPWLPAIGIMIAIGLVLFGVHKLIVKHWGSMGAFWSALWQKTKDVFNMGVKFIKFLLGNFTPVGLIYTHWSGIVTFFKGIFHKVFNFLHSIFPSFMDAGANIMKSVAKGIMNFIHAPVDSMKKMVTKIRNLLPFSPAKDGPLKDIHRIRLFETITEGLRPAGLVNKVRSVAAMVAGVGMQTPQGAAMAMTRGGDTIVVHLTYSPQYYGGSGDGDIVAQTKQHAREMADILQREIAEKLKRKY